MCNLGGENITEPYHNTQRDCDSFIIAQTTPFVKAKIGKSDRGSIFFTYAAENKDNLFLTLSLFSTIIVLAVIGANTERVEIMTLTAAKNHRRVQIFVLIGGKVNAEKRNNSQHSQKANEEIRLVEIFKRAGI